METPLEEIYDMGKHIYYYLLVVFITIIAFHMDFIPQTIEGEFVKFL